MSMNRMWLRHLVIQMHAFQACTALEEYGTRVFGREIRGSWPMFFLIAREAVSGQWGWDSLRRQASFSEVEVPTYEEFATFMLHEVAHGWCFCLKRKGQPPYANEANEEQVCWEVSKLVCQVLQIAFHQESADQSYQAYLFGQSLDRAGQERIMDAMKPHHH